MINVAKAPIDKLLGYAMRAEVDSEHAYTEMSTRVKNPLLVEKFRMLAFEEKKHKTVLDSLFEAMYPGDAPEIQTGSMPKLLPAVIIRPSVGPDRRPAPGDAAEDGFPSILCGAWPNASSRQETKSSNT